MAIGKDKQRISLTMLKTVYQQVQQMAKLKETDASALINSYILIGLEEDGSKSITKSAKA